MATNTIQSALRRYLRPGRRSFSSNEENLKISLSEHGTSTLSRWGGDSEDSERTYFMFSYGSNNPSQVRGRMDNTLLRALPAFLEGFERIFAGSQTSWNVFTGKGAAASIEPHAGHRCLGK